MYSKITQQKTDNVQGNLGRQFGCCSRLNRMFIQSHIPTEYFLMHLADYTQLGINQTIK
jgi:hypothetical protein